ncbi:MAG: glycosyltransferase family 39 protein [Vicinamibacterales bacterium]
MADRRTLLALILALAAAPYFLNLGATSIIDANEAFYAETPREMIESGNYVSPTFNYEPRLNKPPLSYWVVAAFYRVAGVSLGASRLPIALGAMVIVATAFLLGRQAFSARAGWIAAITLAATPRMLLFSRRIIIDVYTAMFLGLTLLCFLMAEAQPGKRRRWLLAMYVAVGLGILVKGPVAVAVPGLVFLVYLLATRQLRSVGRMMLPAGALIVSAIVVPYYAALYAQEGWDAIASFLFRENLARYAEGVGAPDRGPFFYLPVVVADLYFPWSLLLPAALALVPWKTAARGAADARDQADGGGGAPRSRLLLGLWIVVIVVFFSLSKGQQDLYVLPFVVAGAALVGGLLDQWLAGVSGGRLDRVATGSVALAAGIFVIVGAASAWLAGWPGGRLDIAGVLPAAAVIVAGGVAAILALRRGARPASAAALAVSLIAAHWILVIWALPDFERYKPVPHLARAIEQQPVRPPAVGTYRIAAPSLVFYLRRHVVQMVDEEQLEAFLSGYPDGVCVMPAEDYESIGARLPVPTRVIASAPRFDARLSDFLGRTPPRRLLLVSAAR